jgi:hypothetical protein
MLCKQEESSFRDHLLNIIDSKFDKTIYKRDLMYALKSAQNTIRELLKEEVNDLEYDWVN